MEDSPERGISSVNAHSPAVQDSPFFNYLNTLSPIKTVKSVHVAQTFSELHFPPPPAVFTSPRVAIQKETNFPKRSHQNDMGEKASKTYHSAYTGNDKGNSFNGDASHCDSTTPFASATKEAFGSSQTLSTKKFDDKNINKLLSCCGSYHLSDPMEEKNNGKAYTCPINAKYLGFTEQSNSQGAVASCHGVMEEMSIDSEPKDSVELTALLHKATGIGTSQGLAKGSLRMVDLLEQSVSHQNVTTEVVCASSAVDSDNANRQKLSSNNKSLEPNSNHDAHLVACTQDSVTILLANSSVCESNTGQKAPNTECSCVMLQQSLKDITSQCEMTGESNQVDTTPQSLHDSFQGPTGCDDLHRKCDNEQTKPTEHQASFACKSSSHLARGIRRRCLDFEATQAQNKVMNNSLKVLNSSKASASAMTSLNMTSLLPLSHEYKEASEGKQLVPRDKDGDVCESSSSLTLMPFSSCSSKPVNIAAGGMPSGIGLHLNSLATTMSITSGINSPTSAKGPMNKQGPPTLTSTNENLPNPGASTQTHVTSGGNPGSTSTVASGMASSVPETPKIDQQEAHSSGKQGGVTKTISCFRGLTVGIEPMQCGMPLKSEEMNPLGKRPTPHDIPRQPDLSANDEPNQGSRGSPKKKRKSTANSDKEGCKRCNCKKSKCLKLYCECFAAGIYCVEPCTCHECFNKPEYEDMVLGTRQQIESRNPFAFAPKIVCNLNSSSNADNCGATSVSARHKRGCNCKKSMCLKKYCECYQAGVGCSDGCRCGSCKNVFGRKEGGSDDAEDKVHDEAPEKDSSEEKVELHDSGNDTLLSEQHANDLSPITPSLQPFRQAIAMTRSEFSAKKQNVQISVTSQSRSEHPKSPGSCLRPAKGMHGNVTNDTYPHFGPRTSVPLIFSPEAEKSREFSPRWDSFGDICSITPQLHRSLRTSSASNPDSTDAFPINAQSTEIPSLKSQSSTSANNNNESLPLVPRVSATSTPFCLPGKNVWQNSLSAYGSPLAPSLNNTGSNGGTKGVAVAKADFDMHSNDAASLAEDDTPEFLTNTCSPTKGLKANSPNQKRVSPPHHCHEKEINRSLLLSPGLKSGKKFILQSVPSFPVLKTCEDDDKD